jgi:hypothetical protein
LLAVSDEASVQVEQRVPLGTLNSFARIDDLQLNEAFLAYVLDYQAHLPRGCAVLEGILKQLSGHLGKAP